MSLLAASRSIGVRITIMLIFEIIPSLSPIGGAESFVLSLSEYLSKSKNKVIIISLYNLKDSFIDEHLLNKGIQIIYLNKRKGIDLKCSRDLRRIINKYKPDICHLHLHSYLTFYLSGCAKKTTAYYTFHTLVSKSVFGSKIKPKNLLLKHLLNKEFLRPIGISKVISKSITDYFSLNSVPTIYNGVDLTRFTYDSQHQKKYTFISIGRLVDLKNNLLMIKSFERISKRYENLSYLVVGSGKKYNECVNYCKNNKIEGVFFAGTVHNVHEYLAQSKCLLLASKYEGNPMVLNEAIASGVWAICSNVGGIPDVITPSCGSLVTPNSIESLVEQMNVFLDNENDITLSIIPSHILENRIRVSIDKTAEEYYRLFKKGITNEE